MPRHRRPARLAAVMAVPLLLATACTILMELRLEPGSTVHDLAFTATYHGEPVTSVREFEVYACRPLFLKTPVWKIVRDAEAVPSSLPLRITYGRVPFGYREVAPAQPLATGKCYAAVAEGARVGSLEFRVEPDGRVVGVGLGMGALAGGGEQRQVDSAVRNCAFAYRAARSAPDTAAVDERAYPLADTAVSCRTLRTVLPDQIENPPPGLGRRLLQAGGAVALLIGIFIAEDAIKRSLD